MREQRKLALYRSEDCVARARERDEEGIPLRVHLVAAVGSERLAQQPLVVREHLSVAIPQLLDEPRRALDVREEEGDCAARKVRHRPRA